jgi:hypothetical protein
MIKQAKKGGKVELLEGYFLDKGNPAVCVRLSIVTYH